MDEETTIQTPEVEAPPEPEAVPETTPEQDYAKLKADLEAERAKLEKDRKALSKGFNEIAQRERELTKPTEEDVPELDPTATKALEAFMQKKYGTYFNGVESLYDDLANSELVRVAKENDIEPDTLRETIVERGLAPQQASLSALRTSLETAAKLVKADNFSPDTVREEIRAEEREKLLKELNEQGVNIEAVKPKRSDATAKATSVDFDRMTPDQKIAWYKDQGRLD